MIALRRKGYFCGRERARCHDRRCRVNRRIVIRGNQHFLRLGLGIRCRD